MMTRQVFAAIVLCAFFTIAANAYDDVNETYYPMLKPPSHLYGVATYGPNTIGGLSGDPNTFYRQLITIESLQGLLLKNGCDEGIHIETWTEYQKNLEQILLRRAVTHEYVESPKDMWWLINHFMGDFSGQYVLYDWQGNPDSQNAAKMGAYKYDAIMIDLTQEADAIANGLTMAIDVSSYDDQWILDNWVPTWPRKDYAIDSFTSADPAPHYTAMTNEYAAAVGAICFREPGMTPLREAFLDVFDIDTPLTGWPTEEYGELPFTMDISQHDIFGTAINSVHNTALYSSLREPNNWPLDNPEDVNITADPTKHYVCFIWSDGDNTGWHNHGYCWHQNWWANPHRGRTKIGWPISLTCRDLGAVNVEYRYETATSDDGFLAVGSPGYHYPGHTSDESRNLNVSRILKYMRDLDLRVLMLLDKATFERPEVFAPYMASDQVDGMYFCDVWGDYAEHDGRIAWINDKPLVSAYMVMHASNKQDVAAAVNARPVDITSWQGYSMIYVGAWSTKTDDIARCDIQYFNDHIEVVTPAEMIQLIKDNITPTYPTRVIPKYKIDLGDSQYSPYSNPGQAGFTITTNSTEQMVDATPSTKIQIGTEFKSTTMNLGINASDCKTLSFNIYSDGGNGLLRFALHNSSAGSFFYHDVDLGFTGWRKIRLTFETGIKHWEPDGDRDITKSSFNYMQLSGPWGGSSTSETVYIDNLTINEEFTLEEFIDQWLTAGPQADLNDSGEVDFIDYSKYSNQ